MKLSRGALLLLSGLTSFAMAEEASHAANIFVQDPALFHRRQAELQKIQSNLSSSNEALEALLADADKIAKKSDQCATISINDVLDETCWNFYEVELPAFEESYMKVTGELRLGYMETARGLEDRRTQIDACADAFFSFINSKDESVNLDGEVFLEPLTQGFEANYNFTLQYEPNLRKRTLEIAQQWGEACQDMVIRRNDASFAPYFIERVNGMNKELQEKGSLAVIKIDSSASPTIYLDIAKAVRGAYYLNGVKLFHTRIGSGSADKSNLRIAFTKDGVLAGGETAVTKIDGTSLQYKGVVKFDKTAEKVNGRLFWENNAHTEGLDFGPEYDEDSLAVAQQQESIAACENAEKELAEKTEAAEQRKGIQSSFWAAFSGSLVSYTDESVCSYIGILSKDCQKRDDSYLFKTLDLAAAARLRVNFSHWAESFVTIGVGGMVSTAIYDGEIRKTYVAPLAQLEIGYKNFGVRETAIFPIPEDNEATWTQFRTGGFYGIGLLNIELGYTIIMNAGSGFYGSLGVTF
ncbi:MAG: hypothetical protein MJZ25_14450 [Fibrobacter sp.]|nr:hypothetical protein [Fibrobacter sp.]